MSEAEAALLELEMGIARLSASSTTVQERAEAILDRLGRILTFDAGWLAVCDPEQHRHLPLATTGPADPLREYFRRPEADGEVDRIGLNRRRSPMLASEIPVPLPETQAWAEHLLPAGFREGLAAGLFTADGRHIGFLSLLSADPRRPSEADRRLVAAVSTAIADDLDRSRDIGETARVLGRASAGVLLTRGGNVRPLPGLPADHRLLPGSRILTVAADELAAGGAFVTFLAPAAGADGQPLIRVTALDCARPDLDHLSAAVVLCPAGDLGGLTVLDLRLLGLMVDGMAGVPALARAVSRPSAAVRESLERSLAALRTSDLTAATVRALRSGLRIPPGLIPPT